MKDGCPGRGGEIMILDKGICNVYSVANSAASGDMPQEELSLKCQSWYGELNFATTPKNEEFQEFVVISAKIRIHQNRNISTQDKIVLSDMPGITYEIVSVYHGTDKDNRQAVSDISLSEVQADYDIAGV